MRNDKPFLYTFAKNHFILSFKQMGRERIVSSYGFKSKQSFIISTICKNYKLAINMTFLLFTNRTSRLLFSSPCSVCFWSGVNVKLLLTSVTLMLESMKQVHSAGEKSKNGISLFFFFLFLFLMNKRVHCHEREREREREINPPHQWHGKQLSYSR
jgi:hypothetical protein